MINKPDIAEPEVLSVALPLSLGILNVPEDGGPPTINNKRCEDRILCCCKVGQQQNRNEKENVPVVRLGAGTGDW